MEKQLILQSLSNLGKMVKLNFYVEFESITPALKGNPNWTKHLELINTFTLEVTEELASSMLPVSNILNQIDNSLISANFLCFNRGGYKSFNTNQNDSNIRLVIFFNNPPVHFCVVSGLQVFDFEPGVCYLFNPQSAYSMFSFIDKVICLELILDVSKDSFNTILSNLDIY